MFKKGEPRPANAGRKKGSLNKKKVAKVADFLAQKDINPAEKILELITTEEKKEDKKKDVRLIADLWCELLAYTQAKPKEEELPEEPDESEEFEQLKDVTDSELIKLTKLGESE